MLFQVNNGRKNRQESIINERRKHMITISVIIGSTRQGRFSEKPAQWILEELRKREAIEARLLDLRDFSMPFFDQPLPPAMPGRPPYEHDVVKKWTAQIAASDGFVFVTPEYNYGTSAVLKIPSIRFIRRGGDERTKKCTLGDGVTPLRLSDDNQLSEPVMRPLPPLLLFGHQRRPLWEACGRVCA
jgi:NADPH-dependent FMN reductase